jgi:catalase (peroxidase I)
MAGRTKATLTAPEKTVLIDGMRVVRTQLSVCSAGPFTLIQSFRAMPVLGRAFRLVQ